VKLDIKSLLVIPFVLIMYSNIASASEDLVERGRYLIHITRCNECHTPGYVQQLGNIPEEKWLTGNSVGFKGPWGITFPENLRLMMQEFTEDGWVHMAKTFEAQPPMPWFSVHAMSEQDQRAIYQFIRSLGPAGEHAPESIPPGGKTEHEFIVFEPVSAERE